MLYCATAFKFADAFSYSTGYKKNYTTGTRLLSKDTAKNKLDCVVASSPCLFYNWQKKNIIYFSHTLPVDPSTLRSVKSFEVPTSVLYFVFISVDAVWCTSCSISDPVPSVHQPLPTVDHKHQSIAWKTVISPAPNLKIAAILPMCMEVFFSAALTLPFS